MFDSAVPESGSFSGRRPPLIAALLVGKGLDAVSTVVVLELADDVEETIPLALWLMGHLGVELAMVVLTVIAVLAVALVAEAGTALRWVYPELIPYWYPPTLRTVVYVVGAVWFAAVGVQNFLLLV